MPKNLPTVQETRVRSLDWEDYLEKGMVSHSSILTWRIPRIEKPGVLQPMGSQRVGHDWVTNIFSLTWQSFKASEMVFSAYEWKNIQSRKFHWNSLPPVSQSPISQEHRSPSLYFLVGGAPSRRSVASTFLILSVPEAKFRAGALDRWGTSVYILNRNSTFGRELLRLFGPRFSLP